jgi:predicted outer membrane protein
MSENKRFEIIANVFFRRTGMIAPGKSDWSLLHSREDRLQEWADFNTVYGKAINDTIDVMLGIEAKPPLAQIAANRAHKESYEEYAERMKREQVEHEVETMDWIRRG